MFIWIHRRPHWSIYFSTVPFISSRKVLWLLSIASKSSKRKENQLVTVCTQIICCTHHLRLWWNASLAPSRTMTSSTEVGCIAEYQNTVKRQHHCLLGGSHQNSPRTRRYPDSQSASTAGRTPPSCACGSHTLGRHTPSSSRSIVRCVRGSSPPAASAGWPHPMEHGTVSKSRLQM